VKIYILAPGLVWAASLYGQHSWQDDCFKNPAIPYCPGRDFAVKQQPPPAPPKEAAPRRVVTNPFPSTQRTAAPALIDVGGIDWRFADPFPDVLVGLNFSGLAASPLARDFIVQLGAKQGLSAADVEKIFNGMSEVEQVAFSMRNNRAVAMLTGHVTDTTLPAQEAGFKAVTISGNAMLLGHPDAVDQAMRRMAFKGASTELTRLAEERQAGSEFWIIGSVGLVGPQAVSAGVKRFFLTVSLRDRMTSDVALEFNGVPNASALRTWQATAGAGTLEGNTVHVRRSMEGEEAKRQFGQILAGPLGKPLGALVEAARYLPARDTTVPKRTKPVIYGLDEGPREVN